MASNATGLASRFEGRLFSDNGRLHFVLDVDTEAGVARVSCRGDGGQQVIEMAVSEVARQLSSSSNLNLDTLNATETSNRIIQKRDGWFFTTREGQKGPYPCEADANLALSEHILAVQAKAEARAKGPVLASTG